MNKKMWKQLTAVVCIIALLLQLTPPIAVSEALVASDDIVDGSETPAASEIYDFFDDFQADNFEENWETLTMSGQTPESDIKTPGERVLDSLIEDNYALKLPMFYQKSAYVVAPREAVWPGGKPTNFQFDIMGTPSNANPGIYAYYDKATGARAGFTLANASRTVDGQTKPVLTLTWQSGADLTYMNAYDASNAVSGSRLNTSYLSNKVSTLDATQWVHVEVQYNYQNWQEQDGRELYIDIRLSGKNAFTGEDVSFTVKQGISLHYKLTSCTPPDDIYCAFSNIISDVNTTRIDNVKIQTDWSGATNYRNTYAEILEKSAEEVTYALDSASIGAALHAYDRLDSITQALLLNEKVHLDALVEAVSDEIPLFTGDDFENSFLSRAYWEENIDTASTGTQYRYFPPEYVERNDAVSIQPSALAKMDQAAGENALISHVRQDYWPTGKPLEIETGLYLPSFNEMPTSWSSVDTKAPKIYLFFDPVTRAYAGIEFGRVGNNNIAFRGLASSNITATFNNQGNIGQSVTTEAEYGETLRLKAVYDYSNYDEQNKLLRISISLYNEADTLVLDDFPIEVRLNFDTQFTDAMYFGFGHAPDRTATRNHNQARMLIDYIKINRKEPENSEIADTFKQKYASILQKDIADVTITADGEDIAGAIREYQQLPNRVQALLHAEYSKLEEMRDLLSMQLPQITLDSFDSLFVTQHYWSTHEAASLSSDYTLETFDGISVLTVPAVSADSHTATLADSRYMKDTRIRKVTARIYKTQDSGYSDGRFYLFYDPATDIRFGLEFSPNEGIIRKTNNMDGVTFTGTSPNLNVTPQQAGWFRIEAEYDYLNFNPQRRELIVNLNIWNESNGNQQLVHNYQQKWTFSEDVYNQLPVKFSVGIGSDVGTAKTRVDYIGISYFSSDERFLFDDFTGTVTRYIGTESDVVIPEQINAVDVKGIGNGAFSGCTSLNSVRIPDTVETIGANAFSGCTGLMDVFIPASVSQIGADAFSGCPNVLIIAPEDSYALQYAETNNIQHMAEGDPYIGFNDYVKTPTNQDVIVAATCDTGELNAAHHTFAENGSFTFVATDAAGKTTERTITVSNIDKTPPAEATFAPSVTYITNRDITVSIAYPNDAVVKQYSTDGGASWMDYFGAVTITQNCVIMAFSQDAAGNSAKVTQYAVTNIEKRFTFDAATGTIESYAGTDAEVIIPSKINNVSVKKIAPFAFYYGFDESTGCTTLKRVEIPNTVTKIDGGAFYRCTALQKVVIPESVTSIEGYAFSGCSSLTDITLPSGLTCIREFTFSDCVSLREIAIPSSVTSIEDSAFAFCDSLFSLQINAADSITIQSSAFTYCKSLRSVVIQANDFAAVSSNAFGDCKYLRDMTIYGFHADIDEYAFQNSTVESISIDCYTANIDPLAFSDCYMLQRIDILNNCDPYVTVDGVLYEKESLTALEPTRLLFCPPCKRGTITIPASVESINPNVFLESRLLNWINVDPGNPIYSSINGVLYNKAQTEILFIPYIQSGWFQVPDNIVRIDADTFVGLVSHYDPFIMVIPDTVTYISPDAFADNSGMMIYCNPDSYAESYAVAQNIPYQYIAPPSAPGNLTATREGTNVHLQWEESTGNKVDYYIVYRNSEEIARISDTEYKDVLSYEDWAANNTQNYTVKAVSILGLVSDPSTAASVRFYVFIGDTSVAEDLVVAAGEECLLLPGAKVTFQSGARLIIRGLLTATGTTDQPINILGYGQTGNFIIVEAGGIFHAEHSVVIKAGEGTGYCIENSGELHLSDSYISSAASNGIALQSQQNCTITGSTIIGRNCALLLNGTGSAVMTITDNTFTASTGNAIYIKNNAQNTINVQRNTVARANCAVLIEGSGTGTVNVTGNNLQGEYSISIKNGVMINTTGTGTVCVNHNTISCSEYGMDLVSCGQNIEVKLNSILNCNIPMRINIGGCNASLESLMDNSMPWNKDVIVSGTLNRDMVINCSIDTGALNLNGYDLTINGVVMVRDTLNVAGGTLTVNGDMILYAAVFIEAGDVVFSKPVLNIGDTTHNGIVKVTGYFTQSSDSTVNLYAGSQLYTGDYWIQSNAVLNVTSFASLGNIHVSGSRTWEASTVKVNGQVFTGAYIIGSHTILNGPGTGYWADNNETVSNIAVTLLWREDKGGIPYAYLQYTSGGRTKRGYVPISVIYMASGSISWRSLGVGTKYTNRGDVDVYNTPVLANSIGLISMNYPVTVLATDGSFYFVEYKVSATGKLKRGYIWNSQLSAVKTENTPITIEIKNKITHMYVAQSYSAMRAEVRPYGVGNVVWHSSDENRVWIDENTGRIIQTFISGTSVITASVVDPQGNVRASTSFTITVQQKLNYPDTLITKKETKLTLLNLLYMRDEAFNAYLHDTINWNTYDKIDEEMKNEMDLARAEYIVEGDNPTSDFAYAFLGGDRDSGTPFKRILYLDLENPLKGPDVMVLQLALQLNGSYEDDVYKQYGVYDKEVHIAAMNMSGLLMSGEHGLQLPPSSIPFTMLFNSGNKDKRTSYFIEMIQAFRIQHREVQLYCWNRLNASNASPAIEVTIAGGSLTGGDGRADLMAKGAGGSYIWEVKHDSQGGVLLGRRQLAQYIMAANSNLEQEIMIKKYKFKKPVLMGQQLFNNVAIPHSGKGYLKLRHDVPSGLIMYDRVDEIPPGYQLAKQNIPIQQWEQQKAFDFVNNFAIEVNTGTAYAGGLSIDSSTGFAILGVVLVVAGVACVVYAAPAAVSYALAKLGTSIGIVALSGAGA